MCGFASKRISSGAPCSASVCRTKKDALALCAGIQLAVRKRAGAALAELHVAFAVERAGPARSAARRFCRSSTAPPRSHDNRLQPGAGPAEGRRTCRPARSRRRPDARAARRPSAFCSCGPARDAHGCRAAGRAACPSLPATCTSTVTMNFTSLFRRASTDRLTSARLLSCSGASRSFFAARAAQIGARIPERHRKISYADHRFSPFLRMASAAAVPAARPVAHAKCRL